MRTGWRFYSHRNCFYVQENLNNPGSYIGDIQNEDMIGKTTADLIARWNEAHPDDPVEEAPEKPDKPDKPGKPKNK